LSDPFFETIDAREWAAAFCRAVRGIGCEIDEDSVILWFANALMRGYDEGLRQGRREIAHVVRAIQRGATITVTPNS